MASANNTVPNLHCLLWIPESDWLRPLQHVYKTNNIQIVCFAFALSILCMVLRFLTKSSHMAKDVLDISVRVTLP